MADNAGSSAHLADTMGAIYNTLPKPMTRSQLTECAPFLYRPPTPYRFVPHQRPEQLAPELTRELLGWRLRSQFVRRRGLADAAAPEAEAAAQPDVVHQRTDRQPGEG